MVEEFRRGKQKVQAEEQDEEAEQDGKRLPREEAGFEVSELFAEERQLLST